VRVRRRPRERGMKAETGKGRREGWDLSGERALQGQRDRHRLRAVQTAIYGIKEADHRQFQAARAGYGVGRRTDCAFDAADQSPDGASATEQEGPQLASGVVDDGEPAPATAGLFEAHGLRPVRGRDAEAGFAPLRCCVQTGRPGRDGDARVFAFLGPLLFGMTGAVVPQGGKTKQPRRTRPRCRRAISISSDPEGSGLIEVSRRQRRPTQDPTCKPK